MKMANRILELKNISKSFPGVKALNRVDFIAEGGKINCLVGENGAGKSTLIKILAGVYKKDVGDIFLNGDKISIHSLQDAKNKKINFIFQDTNLCDKLSVFENYTLGKEIAKFGVINKKAGYEKASRDFQRLGVDIALDRPMHELSIAEKQIIEILKAFDEESEVIVYDEPSSALTEKETQKLFTVINTLKSEGVIVIYISHRLEEIFEIGDYVTVLRNGQNVGSRVNIRDIDKTGLINLIVGEGKFKEHQKDSLSGSGEVVLSVDHLITDELQDISFQLIEGEILGVTGLLGSGYDKLARTLYGLESISSGEIKYNNRNIEIDTPHTMVKNGIGFIPENRREEALFGVLSVKDNGSV
jgi:ribose transport system ATP-binding protein